MIPTNNYCSSPLGVPTGQWILFETIRMANYKATIRTGNFIKYLMSHKLPLKDSETNFLQSLKNPRTIYQTVHQQSSVYEAVMRKGGGERMRNRVTIHCMPWLRKNIFPKYQHFKNLCIFSLPVSDYYNPTLTNYIQQSIHITSLITIISTIK